MIKNYYNINGNQSVKISSASVKFKNCFKQLAVPFRIYADFESILKRIHSNDRSSNAFYPKKYQAHVSYSFPYKVVCIDDRVSQLFFKKKKIQSINLLKKFLKKINIAKR